MKVSLPGDNVQDTGDLDTLFNSEIRIVQSLFDGDFEHSGNYGGSYTPTTTYINIVEHGLGYKPVFSAWGTHGFKGGAGGLGSRMGLCQALIDGVSFMSPTVTPFVSDTHFGIRISTNEYVDTPKAIHIKLHYEIFNINIESNYETIYDTTPKVLEENTDKYGIKISKAGIDVKTALPHECIYISLGGVPYLLGSYSMAAPFIASPEYFAYYESAFNNIPCSYYPIFWLYKMETSDNTRLYPLESNTDCYNGMVMGQLSPETSQIFIDDTGMIPKSMYYAVVFGNLAGA